MLSRIWDLYFEWRCARVLKGERPELICLALRNVWARADTVYRGRHGHGAILTHEYAVLERFLLRWRSAAVAQLRAGLDDSSAVVVAYCIVGLGMVGQPVPPLRFTGRTERLPWRLGCQAGSSTLEELATYSDEPANRD
ncbi:MAG: hypothetical protein HOV80_03995 [Polyangiaceae bacterium]|nr:hypothetical protein [Polyangiaceae bacterium]